MSIRVPIDYGKYQCKGGDMWDSIAFELYGDETFSTDLIQANKTYINAIVFTGGEIIKYPIYTQDDAESSTKIAPWR